MCILYIYIHYHIISYVSYTSKIQIASSFLDWEEVWTLTTPGHRKIAGGVSYAGKFGIFEFIQGHRKHLFAHSFFNSITPGSRAFFSREQPFSFQSSCRKFFRAWVWDDRAVSVVLLGKLLAQKSKNSCWSLNLFPTWIPEFFANLRHFFLPTNQPKPSLTSSRSIPSSGTSEINLPPQDRFT